jgi:hypothetical protein
MGWPASAALWKPRNHANGTIPAPKAMMTPAYIRADHESVLNGGKTLEF